MHHTQIFDAMKGIVEAPGSPLLKRNQDDFYKHDHRQIEENWDHHARFLWAVGVNGTHLVRLGIHQRSIDAAAWSTSERTGEQFRPDRPHSP